MKQLFVILITGFAVATLAVPIQAQVPASPRELGMGGAYMGIARGFESVYLAPGNIALPDAPRWSFAFPQVAFGGNLRGPEFTDIPDIIEFDEMSVSRQDELLDLIPDDGTQLQYAFRAPLAAFTSGGFGLGVAFASVGSHTLSRDLAELLLEGYEEGRTDYAVENTFGERAVYWDFAASYGREFSGLSIGATAHYLRGRTIARTQLFEPRINIEAQDIEVDYIGVLARGGSGYSVDVGAAFKPTATVTVSGAVSNALSSMTWSDDLKVRSLLLDRNLIDNASPQDLLNRYENSEFDFDQQSAPLQAFEVAAGLYDEAYFPAVARMGIAWAPYRSTQLAADFHRKLTDGRFGDAWDQRISIGLQQELPIISLRVGYAVGNDGGNLLGGGVSLGPLDVGVARFQVSDIEGDLTRGWIGTFGLGVDQPF